MSLIKECVVGACSTIITGRVVGAYPAIVPETCAIVIGKTMSRDAMPNGIILGEDETAVAIPQSLLDKYVEESMEKS